MEELERLAYQLARSLSIERLRSQKSSIFTDFSVEATTKPNDGNLSDRDGNDWQNKCFFISIYHALEQLGIMICPVALARTHNMLNHELIDTDYGQHLNIIWSIANTYKLKIEFYIGQYDQNGKWMTTPDPSCICGTGSRIVRILNKPGHFELLTKLEQGFMEDLDNSDINVAVEEQERIFHEAKRINDDAILAKYLFEHGNLPQETELRNVTNEQQERIQRGDEQHLRDENHMDNIRKNIHKHRFEELRKREEELRIREIALREREEENQRKRYEELEKRRREEIALREREEENQRKQNKKLEKQKRQELSDYEMACRLYESENGMALTFVLPHNH